MKTSKNKLTNLLKIGIIFFGISLLLWNCENDDIIIEQPITQNNLSQVFENTFNADDFLKTLRYQYTVDWSNPKKQYSEQLNSCFYEFPINYSNAFNPDVFNKQVKRMLYEKYKIIVTEKEEGKYEFFIAKYFLNSEKSLNVDYKALNISKNSGYEATLHLYNKDAEMTLAKHISNEKELKDFYLKTTTDKDDNLQQRWVDVCKTTTIYHYKDWY